MSWPFENTPNPCSPGSQGTVQCLRDIPSRAQGPRADICIYYTYIYVYIYTYIYIFLRFLSFFKEFLKKADFPEIHFRFFEDIFKEFLKNPSFENPIFE